MRAVNGLLCLVLIVFALVQVNDPDFLFWFVIYALAAIWCALATFMPAILTTHGIVRAAFLLCLIGAIAGTIYYWPSGTAWWTKDVVWDDELVREGLGMAIVMISLLSVAATWWRWEAARKG